MTRRISKKKREKQNGIALVMAMTTIAILGVMLADMHETTATAFAVSTAERDALRAEYMAKGALNLTRLLVAKEPEIRRFVNPIYQAMVGRPAPQLPVWRFANELIDPFCNEEGSQNPDGFDLGLVEGLEALPGGCEVVAVAENSKVNLNNPLFSGGDQAKDSVALQLFALMGGHQSPSAYDALFQNFDADGQSTQRNDIVSALIDWWDLDSLRTDFDPGEGKTQSGGAEDDFYQRLDDPYQVKNAPFDSLQELRLIRGFGDDFWSTFIEPSPNDPRLRAVTIYASGLVNANESPPQVLLARLCSFVGQTSLCSDPLESLKFAQLLNTVRALLPIPLFSRSSDFIAFVEGKGGDRGLFAMLQGQLGEDNELMFTPIEIPSEMRSNVTRGFTTGARIFNIVATGYAGRAKVKLDAIVNFHARWTPPPPNAGRMPGLGILHYYRVD